MNSPGLTQVLSALVLVAIAIAVAKWWKLPVIKDMALGSVRAFVQLVSVGYALHFIFDLQSAGLIILAMSVMIVIGAYTSAGRAQKVPGAFLTALVAMVTGSLFTLGAMLALDIISFEARYIIPLAGMIIGNSMNASALAVDRLVSDIRGNRLALETSLALGKNWRFASGDYARAAARTGMISILNFMKTAGIVALPGAMTGMILAGADPLTAVYLQLIVGYMLLAATTITSIVAVELTVRKFFTHDHQLKYDL